MLGAFPNILRLLLFLFSSFVFSSVGVGQDLSDYVKYDARTGLPSSHAYHIIQDSKGFIWITTEGGVAKFDGYSFKIFTAKDGLPSDDVFRLNEDAQGLIWLSTFNELGYMYEDIYHKFPSPEGVEIKGIVLHSIFKNSRDRISHMAKLANGNHLLKMEESGQFIDVEPHGVLEGLQLYSNMFFFSGFTQDNEQRISYLTGSNSYLSNFFFDNSNKLTFIDKVRIGKNVKVVKCLDFSELGKIVLSTLSNVYIYDFNSGEVSKIDIPVNASSQVEVIKLNGQKIP